MEATLEIAVLRSATIRGYLIIVQLKISFKNLPLSRSQVKSSVVLSTAGAIIGGGGGGFGINFLEATSLRKGPFVEANGSARAVFFFFTCRKVVARKKKVRGGPE